MVYVMVSRILHLHGLLVYKHIITSVRIPRSSFSIILQQCAGLLQVHLPSQPTRANLTNTDATGLL